MSRLRRPILATRLLFATCSLLSRWGMLEEPEFELGPPRIAFWPWAVHRCQPTNGREFEGKAAESMESETLHYPLSSK